MSHHTNKQAKPQHAGLRLRSPARYDLKVWLFTLGRPRRFRDRMLKPARLKPGETVLDVSCGTGSLALLAKEQVGPEGRVHGVDASEEMVAYARRKAKRAGAEVAFDIAPAQELPFENASFDVVINTLALHHLPKPSRYRSFNEMRRVLRPGGRALVVDFAEGKKRPSGPFGRLKHRHGSVPPEEITAAMRAAGFEIAEAGPIGAKSLHFVLGGPPDASDRHTPSLTEQADESVQVRSNSHVAVVAGMLVAGLLLLHGAAGAAIARTAKNIDGTTWMVIGALALAAIAAKVVWLRRFQRRHCA